MDVHVRHGGRSPAACTELMLMGSTGPMGRLLDLYAHTAAYVQADSALCWKVALLRALRLSRGHAAGQGCENTWSLPGLRSAVFP